MNSQVSHILVGLFSWDWIIWPLPLLVRSQNCSYWVLMTLINLVLVKIDTQTLWGHKKLLENLDFNENPPFSGQKVTHKHCGTFIKISSKLLHSNFPLVEIQTFWCIFDLSEIFGPFRYFSELLIIFKIICISAYLLIILHHIVLFHLFFRSWE